MTSYTKIKRICISRCSELSWPVHGHFGKAFVRRKQMALKRGRGQMLEPSWVQNKAGLEGWLVGVTPDSSDIFCYRFSNFLR